MGKKKHFTQVQKDRILKKVSEGRSHKDVAKEYNLHWTTVSRWEREKKFGKAIVNHLHKGKDKRGTLALSSVDKTHPKAKKELLPVWSGSLDEGGVKRTKRKRRKRRVEVTFADRKHIVDQVVKEGKSTKSMAREYGMHTGTITRWIRDMYAGTKPIESYRKRKGPQEIREPKVSTKQTQVMRKLLMDTMTKDQLLDMLLLRMHNDLR